LDTHALRREAEMPRRYPADLLTLEANRAAAGIE
jgi:hypothetical protein